MLEVQLELDFVLFCRDLQVKFDELVVDWRLVDLRVSDQHKL